MRAHRLPPVSPRSHRSSGLRAAPASVSGARRNCTVSILVTTECAATACAARSATWTLSASQIASGWEPTTCSCEPSALATSHGSPPSTSTPPPQTLDPRPLTVTRTRPSWEPGWCGGPAHARMHASARGRPRPRSGASPSTANCAGAAPGTPDARARGCGPREAAAPALAVQCCADAVRVVDRVGPRARVAGPSGALPSPPGRHCRLLALRLPIAGRPRTRAFPAFHHSRRPCHLGGDAEATSRAPSGLSARSSECGCRRGWSSRPACKRPTSA